MILTTNSPRLLYALSRYHGMPPRPEDNLARTFDPCNCRGATLRWHYRGDDTWEVEEIEGRSMEEYASLRGNVCRLADEHRDRMPSEELVALLIQACIETGLASRADIVDSVEFATMFDAAVIGRVLAKHRGRDASRHLWWVDGDKMYRLH